MGLFYRLLFLTLENVVIMIEDITIISKVKTSGSHDGRLYYFQGNFFFPTSMPKKEERRVAKAIRIFTYKNREKIQQDRKSDDYVPFSELCDL